MVQIVQKTCPEVMRITFKKVIKTSILLIAVCVFSVLFCWDKTSPADSLQTLQDGHGAHGPLVESLRGDLEGSEDEIRRNQRSAKSFSPDADLIIPIGDPQIQDDRINFKDFPKKSKKKSDDEATELDDIFISIKTTSSFHESRMQLLLDTWISKCRKQVVIK